MTDIFISYAHEDHAAVQRMVPLLEAEGFSVWWDHTIPPGRTWDEVIARGIAEARCCIVVWSKNSIGSDWVKEEATMAKDGRKFMPVQIDAAEPPVGFRRIQAANLQGWTGDTKNAQWQLLVREARATVAAAREAGAGAPPSGPVYRPTSATPRKSPPIALIGAVSAGALALIVVAALVWPRPSIDLPPAVVEETITADASVDAATEAAAEAPAAGPTVVPTTASNALDNLMGWWTRADGAGVCRDSYGFRRSGNQVIWTQNEDEYPRAYTVSGGRVGLDSTWRFEPRGNTLAIYDGNERICTFRRGRSNTTTAPPPAPAASGIVGDWSGDFVRTYNNPPSRSPLNITFNANGATDQGAAYTIRGNRITFLLDGMHAMEGTIRGNRISGSWTYASLRGEWEVTRDGSGESVGAAQPPSGGGAGLLSGSWEGEFIRLYDGRSTEPMGPIRFESSGRTDLGDAYTLSGNTVTFDYAGGHHLRGTVSGDRLRGTWTWGDGSLYGEFDLRRQ